jgi:LPXTG-site transpeptidase (sortase) family protein
MGKRVTHHFIHLGFWRLRITARRFKTNKAKRSAAYKQIVIPIQYSSLREVALRVEPRTPSKPVPARATKVRKHWIVNTALPALLVITGLMGAVYFGNQTFTVKRLEPAKTYAAPMTPKAAKPTFMTHSEPTHLTISSVGIDVDTTPVGLDENGSIQMPPLFSWVTGWYDKSPTPGEKGPAVIVGHVDTYKGASVFWRLREVKQGDTILVNRKDGSAAKFRVDSLKQFSQSNFPTKEVYGNIDYAGLRLITCGGTFDKSSEHYSDNTVVYASLVK